MATPDFGIDLSNPKIMGVLNVTPDSFSDGGKFHKQDSALQQAFKMIAEGADILDIGGESSRPGSDPVPIELELKRILPVIKAIREKSDILISVDTYKASVAQKALEAGANWINDISGLRMDPHMESVAADWACPVIVMHMKGVPKTMQINPYYQDVVAEIQSFFEQRIAHLNNRKIKKIILDPGIGFGKRVQDNLILLNQLGRFKRFNFPVLVGTSNKSFIGEITGKPVQERLAGSLASNVWAVLNGASIVRVHEVSSTYDALKMIQQIKSSDIMPNLNSTI